MASKRFTELHSAPPSIENKSVFQVQSNRKIEIHYQNSYFSLEKTASQPMARFPGILSGNVRTLQQKMGNRKNTGTRQSRRWLLGPQTFYILTIYPYIGGSKICDISKSG
jgi:hypothetical protein